MKPSTTRWEATVPRVSDPRFRIRGRRKPGSPVAPPRKTRSKVVRRIGTHGRAFGFRRVKGQPDVPCRTLRGNSVSRKNVPANGFGTLKCPVFKDTRRALGARLQLLKKKHRIDFRIHNATDYSFLKLWFRCLKITSILRKSNNFFLL